MLGNLKTLGTSTGKVTWNCFTNKQLQYESTLCFAIHPLQLKFKRKPDAKLNGARHLLPVDMKFRNHGESPTPKVLITLKNENLSQEVSKNEIRFVHCHTLIEHSRTLRKRSEISDLFKIQLLQIPVRLSSPYHRDIIIQRKQYMFVCFRIAPSSSGCCLKLRCQRPKCHGKHKKNCWIIYDPKAPKKPSSWHHP